VPLCLDASHLFALPQDVERMPREWQCLIARLRLAVCVAFLVPLRLARGSCCSPSGLGVERGARAVHHRVVVAEQTVTPQPRPWLREPDD